MVIENRACHSRPLDRAFLPSSCILVLFFSACLGLFPFLRNAANSSNPSRPKYPLIRHSSNTWLIHEQRISHYEPIRRSFLFDRSLGFQKKKIKKKFISCISSIFTFYNPRRLAKVSFNFSLKPRQTVFVSSISSLFTSSF